MNKFFFAFIILCALSTSAQAKPMQIIGHRAVYNISLLSHKIGASVVGLNGQMTYILKPMCNGFIVNQQLKLNYQYANDNSSTVQSQFANFENYNGREFQFSSSQRSDGKIDNELRGFAQIGDKSFAKYTIPENLSYDLTNDTLFPVMHTAQLLNVAATGGKVFNAHVFDGSDDKGAVEINAVIGTPLIQDWAKPSGVDDLLISKQNIYPISMAVFANNQQQPESEYEITMALFGNGIVRDMTVDYHEFSIRQELITLEKVTNEECGEINNGVR